MSEGGEIPISNLIVVGPSSVEGDIRAGQYYILDLNTMKQVVGTSEEVTDEYKEYLGPIRWNITAGGNIASMDSGSGTEGSVSISGSGNFTIAATVIGNSASKTASATYYITDYYISSFADLQELERIINASSEATIQLTKNSQSSYSPTNGGGLSGAHLRLTNDIDCLNSHVQIGRYRSESDYIPFKGKFDGAGYSIFNIGGTITFPSGYSGTGIASFLFDSGYQARFFNFHVSGTITKAIGRNGCFGVTLYSYLNRISSNMTTDKTQAQGSPNGQAQFYSLLSYSSYGTIEDILQLDTIYASRVVGISLWSKEHSVRRCFTRNYIYINSTAAYTNLGLASPSGENSLLEDNVCFDSLTNLRNTVESIPSCLLYAMNSSSTTDTAKNSYTVKTGGNFGQTTAWVIRKSTRNPTIQNCFYDSDKTRFSRQSDEGATAKTTQQMKSGNLFSNDNNAWIQVAGYYPLLNNQYAVHPKVLESIRY